MDFSITVNDMLVSPYVLEEEDISPVCQNCRFWVRMSLHGECRAIGPNNLSDMATIYTDDGDAMLTTAPFFGCVLFEANGSESGSITETG